MLWFSVLVLVIVIIANFAEYNTFQERHFIKHIWNFFIYFFSFTIFFYFILNYIYIYISIHNRCIIILAATIYIYIFITIYIYILIYLFIYCHCHSCGCCWHAISQYYIILCIHKHQIPNTLYIHYTLYIGVHHLTKVKHTHTHTLFFRTFLCFLFGKLPRVWTDFYFIITSTNPMNAFISYMYHIVYDI